MDVSVDFEKSCFLHVDANVLLNLTQNIQVTEIKSKVYHAEQQIEERENSPLRIFFSGNSFFV